MKLDNKNGNNMKTLKPIENGAMYELLLEKNWKT
jgi:hypothetical protein